MCECGRRRDGDTFVQPYAATRQSRVTPRRLTICTSQSCRSNGVYKDSPRPLLFIIIYRFWLNYVLILKLHIIRVNTGLDLQKINNIIYFI